MQPTENNSLKVYRLSSETKTLIPVIGTTVNAGFPSPAIDFLEGSIDLNELLVRNKTSTYINKVAGESMKNIGILDGNYIVVDRSVTPKSGMVAVCFINNEFTLKRISIKKNTIQLVAENESFPPIELTGESELIIWGVVRATIKMFLK